MTILFTEVESFCHSGSDKIWKYLQENNSEYACVTAFESFPKLGKIGIRRLYDHWWRHTINNQSTML